MNKGFITLPILLIALLGLTVAGGGGYAVYKVNQIQSESDSRVAELEQKIEQIASTTTPITEAGSATTTEDIEDAKDSEVIDAPVLIAPIVKTPVVTPPVAQYEIEPFDMCSNIAGLQTMPPDGYMRSGSECIPLVDKCSNLTGMQQTMPSGYSHNSKGECISDADLRLAEREKQVQAELDALMKPYLDQLNSSQCQNAKKKLDSASKALSNFKPYQRAPGDFSADSAEKNLNSAMRSAELSSNLTNASIAVREYCPTSLDDLSLRMKYSDCTITGNTVSCFSY